ncbi:MAG: diguanylate cyclase [Thiomicrorhabdus sp.]|nr:diguanylate cyclase [Thiomicrorhabdus sp.]
MKIKQITLFAALIWISLISLSFVWNYHAASKERERVAFESAKTFFEYINITRLWNTQHTAVYVPITSETPPNPYINDPNRDLKINEQLTLTQVNPAYMIQQIADIALKQNGVNFHFTNLNPINPDNQPTAREAALLKEFQEGLTEKGLFITENGQQYYFYMAPIYLDETCFNCHQRQDLLRHNIGGGISITSSYIMKNPVIALLFGHILIGVAGLIALFIVYRKLTVAYRIIQKQATIDELTGIPNRRVFSERIITEFKRHQRDKQPLSVIMCDIDHFKLFNDTYGHQAGDQCLRQIAQLIHHTLHRPVDFCARYGGEEFIILLPETDLQGAKHFAEIIRQEVEYLHIPNESALPYQMVTISLGIATTSEKHAVISFEKLINLADTALYNAKKQGRNQVQVAK